MEVAFYILLFIIIYTYLGYGFVIYFLVKVRGKRITNKAISEEKLPEIVHLIAAYNEEDFIEKKIQNSFDQKYPEDKYQVWVVTDGSTDRTSEIVSKIPGVRHFHETKRKGKIHAVNRVMPLIDSEITVFSDANTMLNQDAMRQLVQHYADETIGGVAGEKRIEIETHDEASSSGEGIYWKYESFLKKYDYYLYSVVGAAGELFSIRTNLYFEIPEDTLIEDFFLTLSIAKNGHRIAYEPKAIATEKSSTSVEEESKRKIRIAAGGLQAIWRLRALFNPFKYGWLSFQFVSHRALRWTITPLSLPLLLIINLFLLDHVFFKISLVLQILFYLMALVGWVLQHKKIRIKVLFVPYYFVFMNFSVYLGFFRNLLGSQSVLWERAERKI